MSTPQEMKQLAEEAFKTLAPVVKDQQQAAEALATLEVFCAVAIRVIAKANPSKVRECMRAEWIKGLMDGRPAVQAPSKEGPTS